MKNKEYPDVDGFYWFRSDNSGSFRIVKVSGARFYFCGDDFDYTVRKAQWIGPLMPEDIEIYVSKPTK